MTRKADFNAEEWSLLLEGPPLAAMRVLTADRGGALRESFSVGKAYAEAQEERGKSELLEQVVAERPEIDPDRYRSPEQIAGENIERLRGAVRLVESRADRAEAGEYKRFVLAVARRVAEAHKEGGFLGIGGRQVSEDEQRALEQIAATLGLEDDAPAG
jgi:hypothetical protein